MGSISNNYIGTLLSIYAMSGKIQAILQVSDNQ